MRVSDISVEALSDYLRIGTIDPELYVMLDSARAYVRGYTGLTDAEIDVHEDITIAVYVLVQDMYDNRTLYVDSNNVNKVVNNILSMHCKNLL